MRKLTILSLAVALSAVACSASAVEFKSGPQVGESVGPYTVTKIAGAPHDGVEPGKELCYRCKLGDRPVVMVFAHTSNDQLASLVKELDQLVTKNAAHKMGSFLALLGDDENKLNDAAKKLATDAKLQNVAIVVPEDHKNGPEEYNLNPEADVTVLIYREGAVVANHALPAGALDGKAIQKIVDDTSKILN